jgi:hypothetical protein
MTSVPRLQHEPLYQRGTGANRDHATQTKICLITVDNYVYMRKPEVCIANTVCAMGLWL